MKGVIRDNLSKVVDREGTLDDLEQTMHLSSTVVAAPMKKNAGQAGFFDMDSLPPAEPAYQTLSMSAAAHPLPVKMAGLSQGQVMGATPLAFDTMEVSHTAYAPRYVCLLFSTCV